MERHGIQFKSRVKWNYERLTWERVYSMNDTVHIIGHKNPDTDSIAASIAYAYLKNQQGIPAIACRIGEVNPETAFVLNRFCMQEPQYLANAKVILREVEYDDPITIYKNNTIKEAWDRISLRRSGALYVTDINRKLLGVVSISDLSNILLTDRGERNTMLMQDTPTDNICRVLQGTYIYEEPNYHTNGKVHIVASRKAVHNDVDYRDCIVVLSDDLELQQRVIRDGAACVILVNVDIISQRIARLAKEFHCTVIVSEQDILKVARSIYRSPSIDLIMKRKIISFQEQDYIDDVYNKMSKSRFRSYPVLNKQGEVLGSISRYHLLNYRKKKFILVDHNEISQSIDCLEEGEVLEIVDHHRIGDVQTTTPIRFRNEIIGSTCTIVYKMYKEAGIIPPVGIAGLLCCAILSDTMKFNSPTTTMMDREIAKELAQIANVSIDEIADEMFSSVATLRGRTMSEILYNDFKEYNIIGRRIAIGQINIADEQEIINVRDEFLVYMETINEINKFDLLMMCFTSVDGSGSNLLFIGEYAWIVDEAFKDDIRDDLYFVQGVISRKKQIIPSLSTILELL